ncbi:hypothetical protein K437DRAFT_173958 [Tilletiaria anomala UBC 951]|uniref:Uncharacterized protein n=1 Tax=Tilletiaria anomala (strain ATCC 24038 / CBS 436.72 / UBC 951) TaxID=1037660 RepID=A0A066WNN8_TILAU|nr:uncharacterized protein K437DRAFT_173958 [Tilletiaria anomala UBC 951]KDN52619.1 hypothetical protein K437DRAFT_173958 [Tilletiaria anomala UBC 951]
MPDEVAFLDDIEVESALLSAVSSHRPVGIHRHFHLIRILQKLSQAVEKIDESRKEDSRPPLTGQAALQDSKLIWNKLEEWYDLTALNELEYKIEGGVQDEEDDEDSCEADGGDDSEDMPENRCPQCEEGFILSQTFEFENMIAQRARAPESSEEDLSDDELTEVESPVKKSVKRSAPPSEGEDDEPEQDGEDEAEAPTRRGTRSGSRSGPPPAKGRRSTRK